MKSFVLVFSVLVLVFVLCQKKIFGAEQPAWGTTPGGIHVTNVVPHLDAVIYGMSKEEFGKFIEEHAKCK